jgi:hypothetical protein
MSKKLPDRDYLHSVFVYQDGRLYWRSRPLTHFKSGRSCSMWNAKFAGTRAGRQMPTSPYRQVMVDGLRFLEHRLIAQMHGLDTSSEIDHIDGDGLNNRIENLRAATHSENMRNTTGWAKKQSRVGVHQKPNGRWTAYIRRDGKHCHLGTFASQPEAVTAREAAEREVYGEFARAA